MVRESSAVRECLLRQRLDHGPDGSVELLDDAPVVQVRSIGIHAERLVMRLRSPRRSVTGVRRVKGDHHEKATLLGALGSDAPLLASDEVAGDVAEQALGVQAAQCVVGGYAV